MAKIVDEKPQFPLTPSRTLEEIGGNQNDLVIQLQRLFFDYGFSLNTLANKSDDVVSVKDFGATGDGVTDDAAAIQAAIDSRPFGGTIFFPSGYYLVNSTITVAAALISIVGAGETSIIRINHNTDVIQLNKDGLVKMPAVGIRDINFDCLTNRTAGAVIHVGNVGASRFSNIRISNNVGGRPWNGIVIDAGSQCFFHHIRVTGCADTGVVIGQPNTTSGAIIVDHWFTDCQFDENLGNGVTIANDSTTLSLSGIYLTRCSVFGNTLQGVLINATNQTGSVMSGDYFLTNVILDSNGGNGLVVNGDSTDLRNLRLIDVWSSFNGDHGIFLPAMVKKYEINGGFVLLNGESGITTDGDNGNITGISSFDNNESNNGQYGISCNGAFNTISNCRLFNTADSAFDQNGINVTSGATDTEVINNYCDTEGSSTPYTDAGTRTRAYNNVEDNTLAHSINRAPLTVGNGTAITKHLSGTATLDFDLTSVATEDKTITVTGAADGDTVSIGVPNGSVSADTLFFGWVSAADTVTVRAVRAAGTPNPASGTFRADVWQH